MLTQGPGEIVVAVESRAGAEEEVVVLLEVQHRIDRILARHADRRGRQTAVDIGIVGRRVFQVLVQDAAQTEILHRVFHRRIGLERNAPAQAVDVDPGDAGHLVRLARLLVDDRRQSHHLEPRKAAALPGGIPLGSPEAVVFALHAADQLLGADRPVDLIGVGDEHREEGQRVETHLLGQLLRLQHPQDGGRIGIELPGELAGKLLGRADVVDRDAHGRLQPQLEHPRHLDDAHARLEHVVSRLEAPGKVEPAGIAAERRTVPDAGHQRIGQLLIEGVRADKKFVAFGNGIALEGDNEQRHDGDENQNEASEKRAEQVFSAHLTFFLQRYKKFLLLCPGESYTTSSYRIPQARNRARVCGRSGAI